MKKLAFIFSIFICSLQALEVEPWLGEIYEFHFLSSYSYSFYSSVEGSTAPLKGTSKDHLLYFDLEFPFSPDWACDADLQFVDTPRQSFSYRAAALQLRYLWLDDIVGDPVSLTTGFNLRYTSSRSLHDVSCPYHANVDFQANFSIGKEFDQFEFWRLRIWGYGNLGIANRGSPWMSAILGLEGNFDERHKWGIYADGRHGFGRRTWINISDFNGYAKIRYKAIDIAFQYGYRFGVYGTLKAAYSRRLLAKRYPQRMNTFLISYLLPFSF